jgi:hypothetical protein
VDRKIDQHLNFFWMKTKGINFKQTEARPHNIVYKTLGFKWLFEHSTPHQVCCNLTGKCPAIPNVSYTQPLWVMQKKDTDTSKITRLQI